MGPASLILPCSFEGMASSSPMIAGPLTAGAGARPVEPPAPLESLLAPSYYTLATPPAMKRLCPSVCQRGAVPVPVPALVAPFRTPSTTPAFVHFECDDSLYPGGWESILATLS